ncbi:hypothetical protein HZA39_00160 [Candidatus Peregrinibacteria bacterium]|nr:hypothetical protein [Candidatus Peregrinibacteria bacterium]
MEKEKTLIMNGVMLSAIKPFFKENMPTLMGEFLKTNGMSDKTKIMSADIASKLAKSLQQEAIELLIDPANMAQIIEQFGNCCHFQISEAVKKTNSKLAQECISDLHALVPYLKVNFATHFASNLLAVILVKTDSNDPAKEQTEIEQISDETNELMKQSAGGI